MSSAEVRVRLQHAESFLAAAGLVVELGSDGDVDAIANVVGALSALSGIAAVDAICGQALGVRSASQSHAESVALLEKVAGTKDLVSTFKRLEQLKSASQYSPQLLADGRSRDMFNWASKLVTAARERIG